jgi:hypothetical protein
MWEGATEAHEAFEAARTLSRALASVRTGEAESLMAEIEKIAPAPREEFGGGYFRRRAPAGPPTLDGVSQELISAAMAMQEAETPPTLREMKACDQARDRLREVLDTWHDLEARGARITGEG